MKKLIFTFLGLFLITSVIFAQLIEVSSVSANQKIKKKKYSIDIDHSEINLNPIEKTHVSKYLTELLSKKGYKEAKSNEDARVEIYVVLRTEDEYMTQKKYEYAGYTGYSNRYRIKSEEVLVVAKHIEIEAYQYDNMVWQINGKSVHPNEKYVLEFPFLMVAMEDCIDENCEGQIDKNYKKAKKYAKKITGSDKQMKIFEKKKK